ncbi:MAG: LLM class flavin-dependent oxidoreductase, partial [Candidatus Tectomicrobia bacterium]|nr:LLM class flavin-dependent oxidoreductase [Candidatus Tectomicrobia bacterium]
KDRIPLGVSLPHRSPDHPVPVASISEVAQRADALGFRDLWVTDNTLDHASCLDSLTILTYAAAQTTTIRLGVSVLVLPMQHPVHVAHRVATLDYLSGGRAILGVGLGREYHYRDFQIPTERRVRRFRESVELIKALWTEPKVTYRGEIFQLQDAVMGPKPVQTPHPPLWLGGGHPDALRRAAAIADGWMGAGGSGKAAFASSVPLVRAALEKVGRDPDSYPISKRVFMSVHERPEVAEAEVNYWFTEVYRNPSLTREGGVYGTPEQVREQLEELVAMGANHLLLNPVTRYGEQLSALAEIVGLS